jgi:hypothetical protein
MENTYGNKQPFTEQLQALTVLQWNPKCWRSFQNLDPELKSICNSWN